VNLLALGYGTIIGWSSPFLPVLQSYDSPLKSGPITLDETSWIGSLISVGSIFGTILFGWITERFGTNIAGYVNSLPLIVKNVEKFSNII